MNRDSGTASVNGGWLRRLVRHHGHWFVVHWTEYFLSLKFKVIGAPSGMSVHFMLPSETRERRLGQLLAFAHRTVHVKFDHFKQRFSARKLIPVTVKSLGDYLLLKRIEANLSQPELAVKSGVSVRKVKAWEYDHITPTEAEWQLLAGILCLDSTYPKS